MFMNETNSAAKSSAGVFAMVWAAGIVLSLVTFKLAISGALSNLGFPGWMITFSVLVGIWQWIWIVPALRWARNRNRCSLYNGLLNGAISFSALQLAVLFVLFLLFRKLSLQ